MVRLGQTALAMCRTHSRVDVVESDGDVVESDGDVVESDGDVVESDGLGERVRAKSGNEPWRLVW